jgi:hypothetical protein
MSERHFLHRFFLFFQSTLFWLTVIYQWPEQTGPFESVDAEQFLLYLSSEEHLIPTTAFPTAVFFPVVLGQFSRKLECLVDARSSALLSTGKSYSIYSLKIFIFK